MKRNTATHFRKLFTGAVFSLLLIAPALSQTRADVAAAADNAIHRRMWARSSTARLTRKGRLGCAAAVAEVLQAAHVPVSDTALAATLVDDLLQLGWKWEYANGAIVHPGDVLYGFRPGYDPHLGGGHAHIAIIGYADAGQATIYENSTRRRYWVKRYWRNTRFAEPDFGANIFVLHPPEEFRLFPEQNQPGGGPESQL